MNRRWKRIGAGMGLTGLAIILLAALAPAQDNPAPGASSVTVGTVVDVSPEFIRLQSGDEPAHRNWFKWVGVKDAQPDKDMLATVAKLKAGDKVEIRWSFDDKKRIESVKLLEAAKDAPPRVAATRPAPGPVAAPATAPARVTSAPARGATTAPTPPHVTATLDRAPASAPAGTTSPTAPPTTLGETVNGLIDDMLATGDRLLELPLFMLLAAVGVIGAFLALVIGRFTRKAGRPRLATVLLIVVAVLAAFAFTFTIDRKIAQLQRELGQLRTKLSADAMAQFNAAPKSQAKRQALMFDLDAAQKALAANFKDASLGPVVYDEATDVVRAQIGNPLSQVYLAVIDLRNPAVEIKLGTTLDKKRLTTAFARENDCTVAINGEAGASPAPDSGLGPWKGHMVDRGQVILQEDPKVQRPFLSFDRRNHARFISAGAPDRAVAADAYNVIWGRIDAIVNGEVQTADSRNRQPRTAMGINADGTRLYLMVVDGRQPRYSMGFTRAEVGQFLKAFGASDGMLCDEGGSSCMYLKQFGGITDIPSDNQGQERTTYTHFGITMNGGGRPSP
jgi:hypothetical protein